MILLCLGSGRGRPDARAGHAAGGLAAALERALAHDWRELRIEAECRVEGRLPRVEVFGNGVGIWNDERQFALPREEVRALLVALRDAGFASMRPSYGGREDAAGEDAKPPRLRAG